MELSDRVVVVTGAGSGIGEGLVRRFVAEGARRVWATDIDGPSVQRLGDELGTPVAARRLDVADDAAVQALVDEVLEVDGVIDVFASNAGVLIEGDERTSDAGWETTLGVNLMAHVYAARAVLPSMLERGEGYLVQTVSAAGLLTQLGSVSYAVSKAAALGFAEWMAITHGDAGIKVCAICPQGVVTGMTANTPLADMVGGDGMLTPVEVADTVVEAMRDERFLVLPHPEVADYAQFKASEPDRWLNGMRKLQRRYFGEP